MRKSLPIATAALSMLLLSSTLSFAADVVNEVPASSPLAEVPAILVPTQDQQFAFKRGATGVQIYVCSVKPTGENTWIFIAPSANLYGDSTTLLGTHSIGPVWQDNDGSLVKGAKVSEAPSPIGSLPWLLLKVTSQSGEGLFANVTSIQRVNTVGGLAPELTTCTNETLGVISSVPYTADYYFFETVQVEKEDAQAYSAGH